jgi:hypothetical protein
MLKLYGWANEEKMLDGSPGLKKYLKSMYARPTAQRARLSSAMNGRGCQLGFVAGRGIDISICR